MESWVNLYKLGFGLWDMGKQCRPRSDTTNTASDQGIHCLFAEFCIKIRINMKKIQFKNCNGLIQLIRAGNSIRFKWVNVELQYGQSKC